jgi:hypothetical protein
MSSTDCVVVTKLEACAHQTHTARVPCKCRGDALQRRRLLSSWLNARTPFFISVSLHACVNEIKQTLNNSLICYIGLCKDSVLHGFVSCDVIHCVTADYRGAGFLRSS